MNGESLDPKFFQDIVQSIPDTDTAGYIPCVTACPGVLEASVAFADAVNRHHVSSMSRVQTHEIAAAHSDLRSEIRRSENCRGASIIAGNLICNQFRQFTGQPNFVWSAEDLRERAQSDSISRRALHGIIDQVEHSRGE